MLLCLKQMEEVGYICIYLFMNTCLRVELCFFRQVRVELTMNKTRMDQCVYSRAFIESKRFRFFFFFIKGKAIVAMEINSCCGCKNNL
jgi:hypothetical protein